MADRKNTQSSQKGKNAPKKVIDAQVLNPLLKTFCVEIGCANPDETVFNLVTVTSKFPQVFKLSSHNLRNEDHLTLNTRTIPAKGFPGAAFHVKITGAFPSDGGKFQVVHVKFDTEKPSEKCENNGGICPKLDILFNWLSVMLKTRNSSRNKEVYSKLKPLLIQFLAGWVTLYARNDLSIESTTLEKLNTFDLMRPLIEFACSHSYYKEMESRATAAAPKQQK